MRPEIFDLAGTGLAFEDVHAGRPFLVLAPHPDDEILAAGALMADAAARGVPFAVACLTDGAAARPRGYGGGPELAATRRAECRRGLAAIAPDVPVLFLDRPDGDLGAFLHDPSLARALADHARRIDAATVIVTAAEDAHPDHRAAFALAGRMVAEGVLARMFACPVSQRVDDATALRAFRIPTGYHAERKALALAAHRSQVAGSLPHADGAFHLRREIGESFCVWEAYWPVQAPDLLPSEASAACHFDRLFAANPDPWDYATDPLERHRHAMTLEVAGRGPFGRALDVGCGPGDLTEQLVGRCAEVVAVDVSAAAVRNLRARLSQTASLDIRIARVPAEFPAGAFDLILLSDMLYYLALAELAELAERVAAALSPGGTLVMVNTRAETDTPLSGRAAREVFLALCGGMTIERSVETPLALIDRLGRRR